MRFVLFNIAVVVALFYLFSMERGDFHAMADRLHEGLNKARERLDPAKPSINGRDPAELIPFETAMDGGSREKRPQAAISAKSPADGPPVFDDQSSLDIIGSEEWAELLAEIDAESEVAADRSQESQRETQETEIAGVQPNTQESLRPPVPAPGLAQGLLPVKDPAVSRRRAEVLEGLVVPAPSTPAPAVVTSAVPAVQLAEGEALMSNEERLKRLYVLAEEMELFFVQKLAK